ncbi:MAG: 3-deoxy-D-manno-octulosonic acid transferase [Alphaproteobacteria bacterium]|nr:3-deoxy-D-manno-octulosonic acid transferase [Alphaproteobacteria bacterium]
MSYALYRAATGAISPLLPAYLHWRLRQGKEDGARLGERLGHASLARPEGALLWLHAASVGEAVALLPLMETLRGRYPPLHLLLTTGTVSSARLMRERLPSGVLHQFVPVDSPQAVGRFLRHWRPNIGLWVESELWPNLVIGAHRQGCRMALANGRMSAHSFRRWARAPRVMRRMLRCFSFIAAQSEADAERFRQLGGAAEALGNLKYDAATLTADAEVLTRFAARIEGRAVWLAASTHDDEEERVAEAHTMLRKEFPALLTLIAPRHPQRAEAIARQLAARGVRVQRRTQMAEIGADAEIYIADTLGEMGMWYRLSRIAFIGGSLIPHGGQNPLEAARLSCAILFGPHMENFAEIAAGLEAAGAALRVRDGGALASEVGRLLHDVSVRSGLGMRARIWAGGKTGANAQLVARLAPLIEETLHAHA